MKQAKALEVRLNRADLIAYIAERDRQSKSKSANKAATTNSRRAPESMAWCTGGG